MNVDLLNAVCDRIMKHPASFDMGHWIHEGFCGTTGCIAGHALMLAGDYSTSLVSFEQVATNELELTAQQAERLFHVENWPEAYFIGYIGAPFSKEGAALRAEVAAARIQHFIKTGR